MKNINACALYAAGRKVRDLALSEISEVVKTPGQFVWLDIDAPTPQLMEALKEEFGLHALAAEDAHRARQRPKPESYDDALFIAVNTCRVAEGSLHFGEIHFLFGTRFLVAINHGQGPDPAQVRQRGEAEADLLALGPAYPLYCTLDSVVDNTFPRWNGWRSNSKPWRRTSSAASAACAAPRASCTH
jgi:magnesium transporter